MNNSILPPDLHVKAVSGAIKSVSTKNLLLFPDEKGKENWGKQKWKDIIQGVLKVSSPKSVSKMQLMQQKQLKCNNSNTFNVCSAY